MKILLSAYACEPNKGSEPGVGWNWAIGLSKLGHDVWVLTRSNNKLSIDHEVSVNRFPSNLHFIYYDLPAWVLRFKKAIIGVHIYYLIWQWGAYKVAKTHHEKENFDLAHHVTFVNVRQPSFMGNLGIPFIFGPVGGGEYAPWRLRFHYGIRGFLTDAIRDMMNFSVKFDPFMRRTFRQANWIYVTSEMTKKIIPSCFWHKIKIHLAIGLDKGGIIAPNNSSQGLRVLYIGHFLYWKGMGLGIRAFARLAHSNPEARLTMVGEGIDGERWHRLTEKLDIADKVSWISWVNRKHLTKIYQQHDVFLFPSLHDSGGMVVLEALSHGLPVICLDLGGPGIIVNDSCGCKIVALHKNEKQVVDHLSSELFKLANDTPQLSKLSSASKKRALTFIWEKFIFNLYEIITQSF